MNYFQKEDGSLQLMKSGRSYAEFETATYYVHLDGHLVGKSTEFLKALSMGVAAIYIFNVEFPEKLVGFYQFVHVNFLKLPLTQTKKIVKKTAVKLVLG